MCKQKKPLGVLVLAAGKGTRMRSKTPKVLHLMLEEPIVYYPLAAARAAGFGDIAVIVGFEGEAVEERINATFPGVKIIWQREQKGTGDAVLAASDWRRGFENVMVLSGDAPLIKPETLSDFFKNHIESENACSFLSFIAEDPTGYGRVVKKDGRVSIVEEKDATSDEKSVKEVNSGIYIFNEEFLSGVIDKIGCENAQGEYYLPDAVKLIGERGGRVGSIVAKDGREFLGINDQLQLAVAAQIMRERIIKSLMLDNGLQCMSPESVWIGPKVKVGRDVVIHPYVQLWGDTVVEDGAFIGSFTVLKNSIIRAKANIKGSVRMNDSAVGSRASAGPFAFMREHGELLENAHVGRFVEIKNSTVGECAKVPHLSYIGDASVGENTNIGAGTITCNYDGKKKNRTKIGRDCLVGSDTMFVAPVEIGDFVSTGAGSVITKNIPDGSLGIERTEQKNIAGWSARRAAKKEK